MIDAIRKQRYRLLSLLLVICVSLPQMVYAKSMDVTVASMDKTVYSNLSTNQVYADYKNNAYRASNNYKNYNIGLIGEILSVSPNGKQLELKAPSTDMKFICDCSEKKLRDQVEKMSAGNQVILCGKVKKPNEKEFEITVKFIIPVKDNIGHYENGFTSSDGKVFLADDVELYTIGNYSCYVQKKWSDQHSDQYWKEYIEPEFNTREGCVVQLSSELNTELLGLYRFSWNEVKGKAEKNKKKDFLEFEEEYVDSFLVGKIINRNMNYSLGMANSVPWEKTDYTKYGYFHGTKEEKGKTIHSEIFIVHNEDDLIVITYIYTEEPQYASEVELLLGSFASKKK